MSEQTQTGLLIVPQERRQTPSLSVEAYEKLVYHFEKMLSSHTADISEKYSADKQRLDALMVSVNETQNQIQTLSVQFNEHIEEERVELHHLDSLRSEMQANTTATNDILEIISSAKGFFNTVGVLGDALKWAFGIAAAIVSFWAAWRHLKSGN